MTMESIIRSLDTPARGGEPDQTIVGGKGANLIRLHRAGFPVPDGFILTTDAYHHFLRLAGIENDLNQLIESVKNEQRSISEAAKNAHEIITTTEIPSKIYTEINRQYSNLDRVAVRSSATAEDLPEASFAGQQDTYLNVTGAEPLGNRIQDCWASLFNERAFRYRLEHDFATDEVGIAVVIQEMVDPEKSGVVFTANPSTGAPQMTIEAVYGLGEACVSGSVSPDNYIIDRESGEIVDRTINRQHLLYESDFEAGGIQTKPVDDDQKSQSVLAPPQIQQIAGMSERIEAEYGQPQDIEWAICDEELLILQSRPITTITTESTDKRNRSAIRGDVDGLGASAGIAEGEIYFDPITAVKQAKAGTDVILVRKMTSPSDIHGMKASTGILTSRGGETSHAAIVARELGKPAVVGCEDLSVDYDSETVGINGKNFSEGSRVRIDGDTGDVKFIDT